MTVFNCSSYVSWKASGFHSVESESRICRAIFFSRVPIAERFVGIPSTSDCGTISSA
jgi:hypothetical protein